MTNPAAGVCNIKPEFIVQKTPQLDTVNNVNSLGKHKLESTVDDELIPVDNKKQKTEENKPKIKKKGQNKGRPKAYRDEIDSKPCPSIVNVASAEEKKECHFNNCKYIHNPLDYLKGKPKDIGDACHLFNLRGRCPRGLSCRYGSSHITEEGFNKVDQEKVAHWKEDTRNFLQQSLQSQLQKKKYDFNFSERLVKHLDSRKQPKEDKKKESSANTEEKPPETDNKESVNTEEKPVKISGVVTDEYLIKLLPREKKLIDWKDKLYLSPLTTVGNLPFRRICKEYGADITCGEMALCESLLKGTKQEWALVKRHESEDLFGAQICGNNAYIIAKVAQLLQETTELDFIDLNLGCPIDLIYKKGAGSGMMHRLNALEASVRCASKLLTIPFTIKMRTGIYQDKKITHTIVPKMAELGASLITVHGRSREGRYTRSADWDYVETCAKAAAPCPVFGNGDIMCYQDYAERRKLAPTIQGVMIGRGALIKPWIFTEIKEQKLWDIRSSERFDILKKYTNYGLEHWGSDTQGVENTRRFMLEWLSFLYRYVPVGLLERPPQKINERPPSYFGRDDLETLMASNNCTDWVKISEMLLGPVPDGFQFLPKHKANSY
ncbi:tRNA-dihydrouridine(47) synthase [NAD(P)(+)] [Operophtera brumata]|uniref:tRNA-dihydrouridine(47) synthase [NAD(P)(+)] n=1 Tax=Operophtera brumata TaxID=104452 RepID=A0A0L7KTK5_OPEBR|nr:tRNA-dihydrouridine(47) synthase [NAD(P)(+)] [Operophtera brumata]